MAAEGKEEGMKNDELIAHIRGVINRKYEEGQEGRYDAMVMRVICNSLEEAQAEIERLNGIVNEVNEEAGKARMILLFNHGHKGQYVDDGEMQCGACGAANYDFKKPSLSELVKRIIFGFNTEIDRLKAIIRNLVNRPAPMFPPSDGEMREVVK